MGVAVIGKDENNKKKKGDISNFDIFTKQTNIKDLQ